MDTASRLLRLLFLLQTAHTRWTAAALAERLEVTSRTIRADVDRLRSLGYEVDAVPGAAGGYRLRAGQALPPVLLDDDEAVAVAVGMRVAAAAGVVGIEDHAERAAAKLERLLPPRLRHRLATLSAVVDTVAARRDPVGLDVLDAVATACRNGEQLRFEYLDRHQGSSRRRTEPYRLVHVSGRWYLVAFDLDRDDWRSFRVDRISPKTPPGPRFVRRELPGPDLGAFVTRGRMAALWNYRASVVVDAAAEVVARRIPSGSWAVEPLDAHRCRLDAGAHSPLLLAVYLGALDLDFHIDSEKAPALAVAAATLATRYATAPKESAPDSAGEPMSDLGR